MFCNSLSHDEVNELSYNVIIMPPSKYLLSSRVHIQFLFEQWKILVYECHLNKKSDNNNKKNKMMT